MWIYLVVSPNRKAHQSQSFPHLWPQQRHRSVPPAAVRVPLCLSQRGRPFWERAPERSACWASQPRRQAACSSQSVFLPARGSSKNTNGFCLLVHLANVANVSPSFCFRMCFSETLANQRKLKTIFFVQVFLKPMGLLNHYNVITTNFT